MNREHVITNILLAVVIGAVVTFGFFLLSSVSGCTYTLKTGAQTFHFQAEVPVIERMVEGTTPQYLANQVLDTVKKVVEEVTVEPGSADKPPRPVSAEGDN